VLGCTRRRPQPSLTVSLARRRRCARGSTDPCRTPSAVPLNNARSGCHAKYAGTLHKLSHVTEKGLSGGSLSRIISLLSFSLNPSAVSSANSHGTKTVRGAASKSLNLTHKTPAAPGQPISSMLSLFSRLNSSRVSLAATRVSCLDSNFPPPSVGKGPRSRRG